MAKEVKAKTKSVGAWAFIIGVVLALILGLAGPLLAGAEGLIVWLLVLIGVIVGFLNITGKESQGFLLASVSLVIVSALGQQVMPDIGVNVLKALLTLFVPTTIIVALKLVYGMAKD
jgi:hypothetical protein